MEALARGNPKNNRRVFTVSELTKELKSLLELKFPFIWVEGEISNSKSSANGHLYFSLKDEGAVLKAVMFRSFRPNLPFKLEDGLHVLCFGRLSLYEPRGEYQLIVQQVEPIGYGAFRLALEQLQKKLAAEGLLDEARKRPLPFWPRVIGLITSLHGAAIHDFLRVGFFRNPKARVLIYPVRVQGEEAPQEIIEAIHVLSSFSEVEVLVIARGGGSFEDLLPFNHEGLARAIATSPVPVVSAVGHEIDVTICDLVADARAPTPTAAAEMVFPSLNELAYELGLKLRALNRTLREKLLREEQKLNQLKRRLKDPRQKIKESQEKVHLLKRRLDVSFLRRLEDKQNKLFSLIKQLESLSPLAVLARGYSIVRKSSGQVIKEAQEVLPGEELDILLHQGKLRVKVKEVFCE
ncbi:exodeoxyribonuclease VII large subunit [Thermodesulfatator autotrophicus]|uniref:Exodeoxyribonuclease 7 large subunit n=1 Tax=Thermodesulfatator autotrophicus TaxID=1795632 RepID=A0A177E626_9BACT|nr:exodeoxyribonuclease VII large subunit [Thermodesulfatator autotrophicus]OAG27345.1 hypothetical protein TH606_07340 [Thermodesulfatator autotrophicus]